MSSNVKVRDYDDHGPPKLPWSTQIIKTNFPERDRFPEVAFLLPDRDRFPEVALYEKYVEEKHNVQVTTISSPTFKVCMVT